MRFIREKRLTEKKIKATTKKQPALDVMDNVVIRYRPVAHHFGMLH